MRKIILGTSSVVFAVVSALLANSALAQQVQINGFISGGSGCPRGTSVSGRISATKPGALPDTLILSFAPFRAVQGPGIASIERRKNCNITIDLAVPQGFSFSLVDAEYQGFANLPRGVKGVQSTTYSFPFSNSATFATVLNGPFRSNYKRTDDVGAAVFSPCSRSVPLSIATQVFLSGDRTKSASISVKAPQRYGIQWRRCS
jgi:hypothetical protein